MHKIYLFNLIYVDIDLVKRSRKRNNIKLYEYGLYEYECDCVLNLFQLN